MNAAIDANHLGKLLLEGAIFSHLKEFTKFYSKSPGEMMENRSMSFKVTVLAKEL